MRLAAEHARALLTEHDHGTLCTVHAKRGVDAVPCVYAMIGATVGVPVDRVKPKATGPLQRERNLTRDGRAALLIEHWDREEWSALWWARAQLRFEPTPSPPSTAALAARLAQRFPQYRKRPFDRILVFEVLSVTGWAASG